MLIDVNDTLDTALAMLPRAMDTREARVLLYAIGLQESRFMHRRQIKGPARGFWQFERGGGVRGVMQHRASSALAKRVCDRLYVNWNERSVYDALEYDDVLACCFARLLLWTDPKPLPKIGEIWQSWDYYERVWRPGKPHRKTWADLYATAEENTK